MTPFTPRNILVHVDAANPSQPVLDCATELAKLSQGKLKIVDVIPDSNWPVRLVTAGTERVIEQLTSGKSDQLQAIADGLSTLGVTATTKILEVPSSVAIVREVVHENHDLVIREAKGRHSRRAGFFGTTATRLLRKCPCPVLLLEPGRPWQANRIVTAVDATSDDEVHGALNRKILAAAQPFCQSNRQLDVVSAWSPYGEQVLKNHMAEDEFEILLSQTKAATERRLEDLVKEFDLSTESPNVHLLHGEAAATIKNFIDKHGADLLVLGTIGRSGIAGILIGNVAEQILSQVNCAVLAIKPDDFNTPIRM